jgi:hypothetical protein
MKAFLAAVLSVIAVGVLLIAYGLMSPRAAAAPAGMMQPAGMIQYDARGDAYQLVRPVYASQRANLPGDPYARYPVRTVTTYPSTDAPEVFAGDPYDHPAPAPRRVVTSPSAPRTVSRIEKSSGRDWKKTAMVIGGSSAAGAGLGAIFGGKKGALIGAAIGGGAGTVYEVRK